MAIPVVLDSFSWPTKSAARSAFTEILRSSGYETYDRVTDPRHDLMLRELLERHPDYAEKNGEGVEYFFIGRTSDGDKFNVTQDATGIWIQRTDGSKVDFSYLTAINSNSTKSDAKEALRSAVDGRRRKYRENRFASGDPVFSDVSGDVIPAQEAAQVIYLNPTWAQLTFRFAELEGEWNALSVHSGHGSVKIGSELEDGAQQQRWLAFHDTHAQMRLATSSEAARRARSDERAWNL